jgi:DNA-binding NarL/FixJ family response regulator
MPGLSVRALIEKLRLNRPAIPVLVISDDIQEPGVKAMIDAGNIPFLSKRFTWDELVRAVRGLIVT